MRFTVKADLIGDVFDVAFSAQEHSGCLMQPYFHEQLVKGCCGIFFKAQIQGCATDRKMVCYAFCCQILLIMLAHVSDDLDKVSVGKHFTMDLLLGAFVDQLVHDHQKDQFSGDDILCYDLVPRDHGSKLLCQRGGDRTVHKFVLLIASKARKAALIVG